MAALWKGHTLLGAMEHTVSSVWCGDPVNLSAFPHPIIRLRSLPSAIAWMRKYTLPTCAPALRKHGTFQTKMTNYGKLGDFAGTFWLRLKAWVLINLYHAAGLVWLDSVVPIEESANSSFIPSAWLQGLCIDEISCRDKATEIWDNKILQNFDTRT